MSDSGLVLSKDPRDEKFQYAILTDQRPNFKKKDWFDDGWWGNQKKTPHCSGYAWVHLLEDGPTYQNQLKNKPTPLFSPESFYNKCKEIDGISGPGTSIHVTAKVAKSLGLISEYRWASSVDQIVDALLIHGPIIAGTNWYTGMNANGSGRMRLSGASVGGHAYIINAVDLESKTVRIKNSYGKEWGKNGHGYLTFDDLQKLIDDGGSFMIPFVNKLSSLPL